MGNRLRSEKWTVTRSRKALRNSKSIIEKKFHEKNSTNELTVDSFLSPYLDLDALLREKHIYKSLAEPQSELSEISSEYKKFLEEHSKNISDESVKHDMTLVASVKQLRANPGNSEVEVLLVTCDELLYRFDREIHQGDNRDICVITPNLLLKALQLLTTCSADFDGSFTRTFSVPGFRILENKASDARLDSNRLFDLYEIYSDKKNATKALSNYIMADRRKRLQNAELFLTFNERQSFIEEISAYEDGKSKKGSKQTLLTNQANSGFRITGQETQIVLLVHGIRTHAYWQEMVVSNLQRDNSIRVIPIRYGYLDILSFWSPVFTRKRVIRRVLRQIRSAISENPNLRLSIIAHSFGTYTIGKILQDNPDIYIYRLILSGSILKNDFPWENIQSRIQSIIVNECGTRDIWPVLARLITLGYGNSGTFGFGNYYVRDRYHNYNHSGYFIDEFVNEFWVPLVESDQFIPSKWDAKRSYPRTIEFLDKIPASFLFWLLVFLLILIVVIIH